MLRITMLHGCTVQDMAAVLSSVYFYAAQQMDGKRLATDAVLLVISIVVIAVARLLQKSETGMHTGVPQTN